MEQNLSEYITSVFFSPHLCVRHFYVYMGRTGFSKCCPSAMQ